MHKYIGALIIVLTCFHGILIAEEKNVAGVRGDLAAELDAVGKKMVELAEAMPEEKYSWRPAEGVRSVSEVYMHVSAGIYTVLKFAGVEPPAGLPEDPEKTVTKKSEVIASLKKSLEHVHQGVLKISDADLDNPADFFGQKTTVRGILIKIDQHMHEHLGQSIAYARINGVVPPWSRNQPQ
jgi:uncharacterized damage-inducible protein DinB